MSNVRVEKVGKLPKGCQYEIGCRPTGTTLAIPGFGGARMMETVSRLVGPGWATDWDTKRSNVLLDARVKFGVVFTNRQIDKAFGIKPRRF